MQRPLESEFYVNGVFREGLYMQACKFHDNALNTMSLNDEEIAHITSFIFDGEDEVLI